MITVYGLLGEPSLELRTAAASAEVVVGGARQLDALNVAPQRRITLGALGPAIEKITALPAASPVLVVASGDPLFFGVVRTLRAAGLRPKVVAALGSVAAAFAAVALPWEDAEVVSVHGRPLAAALNLARANPKVAVFTSAEHGVRELAAALADVQRWYVLAERLGEPEEQVRVLSRAQALSVTPVEPNVVLVLAEPPQRLDPAWSGWLARPARAGRQVSAAAAVAFTRLLPEPGELLWATGPLGDEVAALASWVGAAVALGGPTPPGPIDVAVAASPELLQAHQPRSIVITGELAFSLPASYRWQSEQIGDHQLRTGVRL